MSHGALMGTRPDTHHIVEGFVKVQKNASSIEAAYGRLLSSHRTVIETPQMKFPLEMTRANQC